MFALRSTAILARLAAVATAASCWVACATRPPAFDGPLHVRSQHPAQLTVLALPAQDVGTPPGQVRARWTNAYSSLWLAGSGGGNTFRMDGEYLRSAAGLRWGLGHGFEVDVELPVAHTSGGFLDELIVDWHDAFGFPNRGRDTSAKNAFEVRAERLGTTAFELEERSLELLDVPIAVGWTVLAPSARRRFGVALRAAIELPTGDGARGFGNDGVDVALGIVGEYRFEYCAITAHASHTFAETPDRARTAGLEFADVSRVGVGLEVPLWDGCHGLVAVGLETATLRELGFDRVADDHISLWTGLRSAVGERTRLELAIGEDLAAFVAPDITLWLSLLHRFGSGADGSWH